MKYPDIGAMRCEECGIVHERMISVAEVTICRACLEKAINALDGFTRRSKPFIDNMPPLICKKHGREDCDLCTIGGYQPKQILGESLPPPDEE